jgi:hypothetical protein
LKLQLCGYNGAGFHVVSYQSTASSEERGQLDLYNWDVMLRETPGKFMNFFTEVQGVKCFPEN